MITNEIYFFKNQSSVSISDSLYNVNDGVLILQVDGNASNLELSVLGNTDLIDDDFIALKTINATDYSMSDKITSTGIYWVDINGIRKVKLNLSKITGSVNVKALTKRGLTTDLVARAMAANSQSGGCSLEEVKAITGELTNLNTEDKSNLVSAINEVMESGGGECKVYNIKTSLSLMDNSIRFENDVLNELTKIINNNLDETFILFINSTMYNKRFRFELNFKTPTTNVNNITSTVYGYSFYSSSEADTKKKFILAYDEYENGSIIIRQFYSTTSTILELTKSDVLTKTNTTSYTPSGDYNPATKKYVDDTISAKGGDKLHDYNIYTITLDDYNLKGTFPTITDTTTLAKFDEILTDIYKKRISANATHDNAFLIVYSSSDTFIFRTSTIQASYCYLYGTYIEEPIDHNGYTCSYQFYITGTLDTTAQTFKTTKVKFDRNSKRVLLTNNTLSYTPTGDYNPATKKYVDDTITAVITTSLEGSY